MAILYLVSMIFWIFLAVVLIARCLKRKAEYDREFKRKNDEIIKALRN